MTASCTEKPKRLKFICRRWMALSIMGWFGVGAAGGVTLADNPKVSASISATATASVGGTTTTANSRSGYRTESVSENPDSPVWEIYRGERAIATYLADAKGTPGFYPLLSPSGLPLTRNYPMQTVSKNNPNAKAALRFEKQDHPHHRSMWFNHGDVNGTDFWVDKPGPKTGQIVQQSGSTQVQGAAVVINGVATTQNSCTIRTRNRWNTPDGKGLLFDEREFRFDEHLGDTIIDTTIRLIADDQPVVFGDTKEGSFGIRVAGTMKVDAKLGGEIHNAEGLKDDATWSQASDWVDYSGPIAPADLSDDAAPPTADDARTWPHAGITMLYHPANEIDQCRWHVRSYGLFAANPFGRHHFGLPAYDGVRIDKGQSLTLHFRVVLHDGGFDAEKAAEHFRAYAATTPQ